MHVWHGPIIATVVEVKKTLLVSALLCKVEQQDKTSDNKIGKHIN